LYSTFALYICTYKKYKIMEIKSVEYLAERYKYLDTLLKRYEMSPALANQYRKMYYEEAKIMYEREMAEAKTKWNTEK